MLENDCRIVINQGLRERQKLRGSSRRVKALKRTGTGASKKHAAAAAAFCPTTVMTSPSNSSTSEIKEWDHIFSSSHAVLLPAVPVETDVQWNRKPKGKFKTTQSKPAREVVHLSSQVSMKSYEPEHRGLLDEEDEEEEDGVSLLGLETDSSSDMDLESKSCVSSSNYGANSGDEKENRRSHLNMNFEFVHAERRDSLRRILHKQASKNGAHTQEKLEPKDRRSVAFGREVRSVPPVGTTPMKRGGMVYGRYYPMWLMPLADVMDIDVVEPHQVS